MRRIQYECLPAIKVNFPHPIARARLRMQIARDGDIMPQIYITRGDEAEIAAADTHAKIEGEVSAGGERNISFHRGKIESEPHILLRRDDDIAVRTGNHVADHAANIKMNAPRANDEARFRHDQIAADIERQIAIAQIEQVIIRMPSGGAGEIEIAIARMRDIDRVKGKPIALGLGFNASIDDDKIIFRQRLAVLILETGRRGAREEGAILNERYPSRINIDFAVRKNRSRLCLCPRPPSK